MPICQHNEALSDGVCSGSFWTKSVGMWVRLSLRDGRQCEQIQRLLRSVDHTRNTERSQLPILLRYRDSSQRLWCIAASNQCFDGLIFGVGSGPCDSVHSRSLLTLVFSHSSN